MLDLEDREVFPADGSVDLEIKIIWKSPDGKPFLSYHGTDDIEIKNGCIIISPSFQEWKPKTVEYEVSDLRPSDFIMPDI